MGIESPCIGLCQLNQDGKYCIGCKRSIEEIKNPINCQVSYLDKLVDELANGKKLEKILL